MSKNALSFLLSLMFSLQQNGENKREEQVLLGSRLGGDENRCNVAQKMYTHVSKCKNDKIKERKIF
jgi:hypothetical protein